MEAILESNAVDHSATMVKMVLDSWNKLLKEFDAALDAVTDEQLEHPIAPNKNRGIYILGHMVVVHDEIQQVLGFGELSYLEINKMFNDPDNVNTAMPSAQTLRGYWKNINEVLAKRFAELTPQEWFEKHTLVSAEDFATQPHRNKLNVMITRTCHVAHHLGQIKWVQ
jgi:hypothetical protein